MRQKKAITKELKARYNKAAKSQKSVMLDEFCAVTGYNRCYAKQQIYRRANRFCPKAG